MFLLFKKLTSGSTEVRQSPLLPRSAFNTTPRPCVWVRFKASASFVASVSAGAEACRAELWDHLWSHSHPLVDEMLRKIPSRATCFAFHSRNGSADYSISRRVAPRGTFVSSKIVEVGSPSSLYSGRQLRKVFQMRFCQRPESNGFSCLFKIHMQGISLSFCDYLLITY